MGTRLFLLAWPWMMREIGGVHSPPRNPANSFTALDLEGSCSVLSPNLSIIVLNQKTTPGTCCTKFVWLYLEHHMWRHWGWRTSTVHLVSNRSTKPVLIALNLYHVRMKKPSDQNHCFWVSRGDLWWPLFVANNQVLKWFKLRHLISNFFNCCKILEIMEYAFSL